MSSTRNPKPPAAATTQVLIVGGSLNGLTMALLLANFGVRCVVVERHSETARQYKFHGISPRSMEIFRSVGIEDEVRAKRTGDQKSGEIVRGKNLADPDIKFMGKAWADTADLSPASAETCDQERLEPILRAHAERLGADVRFNTEFIGFEQDDHEVRGRIRNLQTGEEEVVTASYLVAADGVSGKTRETLGIEQHGPGVLQHWMNLIFDTDLEPNLQDKLFTSCFVTDINGTFTPREKRWLLALQYQPEKGEKPESFDKKRTAELVRKGAGRDDIRCDLFDARPWEVAAYLADRFQHQRAFLVGDAAHSMPPTGGFGGNTGIHDCHNLAWKLAFVLNGQADAKLLETYSDERRLVAERTLAQALARLSAWFDGPSKQLPPPVPIVDDWAVYFGHFYPNGALLPEGGGADKAFEDPRHSSGRPGARAPHILIDRAGAQTPIHDLFGRSLVLLAGAAGKDWCDAAAAISRSSSVHLPCLRIGEGGDAADLDGQFLDRFGVGEDGAVLVRPDGFVAWRSLSVVTDAQAVLRKVLTDLALNIDSPASP
jgi:putative polyketide hydroxylase